MTTANTLPTPILPCPACADTERVVQVISVDDPEAGHPVPVVLAADGMIWKRLTDWREP